MSVRSDLVAYLAGVSGVSAIAGTRIRPVALEQDDARPAVTVRRMPSDHDHRLSGGAGRSTATFQIRSWGNLYKDADTLGEAVRQAMQGFGGTMGSTEVTSVRLVNDFDDFVYIPPGSGKGVFCVVNDYHVQYVESIPTPS